MSDANQYLVENEVIPEQTSLNIQEQQQENNNEGLHLSGKLPEEALHSNEDDENNTQMTNNLEQLSIQSTTTNNSNEENSSLEPIAEENNIPQVDESSSSISPIREEEEEEEQTQAIPLNSNTSVNTEESRNPEETILSPVIESVDDTNTPRTAIDTEDTTLSDTAVDTTLTDNTATDQLTPTTTDTNLDVPIPPQSTSTSVDTPTLERSTPPLVTTSTSETTRAPPTSSTTSNRGRSASSVNPSTTSSGLLPRSQRVWEMDRQAPECRRCHRRFNFLIRRHHCRRCGQIVCDKCSSHRIRLPVEELIEDPMISQSQYPLIASQSQRVCDSCYREPIRRSSDSHQRRSQRNRSMQYGSQMRRTDSSQSLMIDCPVCGQSFLGMQKSQQEEHLQQCLNVGSPPVHAPRYIVYKLSEDSTQIGDECPICFEDFKNGDKVSRMICLCSYHQHCLASWLERGKGCPVHYDSLHTQDSF